MCFIGAGAGLPLLSSLVQKKSKRFSVQSVSSSASNLTLKQLHILLL